MSYYGGRMDSGIAFDSNALTKAKHQAHQSGALSDEF